MESSNRRLQLEPNWEIDILGKRAFPRQGYLEHHLYSSQSLPSISNNNNNNKNNNDEDHLDPALLPHDFDLSSVSISSVALSTARALVQSTTLLPSPMQCRKLKKQFRDIGGTQQSTMVTHSSHSNKATHRSSFVAGGNCNSSNFWKGGSHSNLQQIDSTYTEILSTVTTMKQIESELKATQSLLTESKSMSSLRNQSTNSSVTIFKNNQDQKKMKRRRSLLDISLFTQSRSLQLQQDRQQELQQRIHQRATLLKQRLLPIQQFPTPITNAFELTAVPPFTSCIVTDNFNNNNINNYLPNDSTLSSIPIPSVQTSNYKPNTSSIPSNLHLPIHPSHPSHPSQQHQFSSWTVTNTNTTPLLTKETILLTKQLENTKSLLSHHLYPHLASAHEGDLMRSKLWHIITSLSSTTHVLHQKYKSSKIRKLMQSGKNRQVAKIQKAWSLHRAYQFQQAILAKEENARLMRVLALVVRCRWRAKNAKKIRNFCIDYSTVRLKN